MNNPFLIILLFGALNFSSVNCEEDRHVEKKFQEHWDEFHGDTRHFPLWKPDWKEDELKNRFDQMTEERWQVYFTNPQDCHNADGVGHYRDSYETPQSFESWGSRYSHPGSFRYNLASPHFNASFITLHGRHFLAMEAPTKENVQAFCDLLDQYHVTDLVRLTPAQFHDRENSFPYWEGHLNINPKNGKTTIEIGQRERNYFFTDCWVNHEATEPARLIALIKAVIDPRNDSQMVAVHCRAGVGRTGTFLAACALIQDIDAQIAGGIDADSIQVSIDRVVWELALQRPFMISHLSQYVGLYQLVSEYVESIRIKTSAPIAFPNYPGKCHLPSLLTPEKSLAYHKNVGRLPSCPPPKTVIFCYNKGMMDRAIQTYRTHPCDGTLNQLYFFNDYPGVAIAYFGIGAPSNAMRLEYLLSWGVKQCISIGLAGGLQKDMHPGDLIVCDRAIRDEGTSHHYLPAEKYAYPSKPFTENLCKTLDAMQIPYRIGATWTTDAFYRQTVEEIKQYQKEGVLTVEMEASALFTVASLHHAEIISYFTISDTVGDLEWKLDFENKNTKDKMDRLVSIALKVASPEVIEIVSYDPKWPQMFEEEANPIQQALGDNCLAIHHFGSTSVSGLSAKPKIDILAVVRHLSSIDSAALERLGFTSQGEVIPTGRYFSKDLPVHSIIKRLYTPPRQKL
jgi:uridine phosphorylase